jgi:hypothetical protein
VKRIILVLLLAIATIVPSVSPASAIFGLGTCEKVSKQILALEKQITNVFTKGLGYNYEQVVFGNKETLWEPTPATIAMVKKVIAKDPVPQIWKLATNNPKCFTNTQNMRVAAMKNSTYNDYFMYPTKSTKYKNTGECKFLMETNERKYTSSWDLSKESSAIHSKCVLGSVVSVYFKVKYQSIYSY